MATKIDLEMIRKKLKILQTSNTSKTKQFVWKPKPGANQIRIVPNQYQKDYPFQELFFHYEFGRKSYLSPATFKDPDPIAEFADSLSDTGNKEDWLMSRKLQPKMRTFVPIIVRGEEKEGTKFWGFGSDIYKELLGYLADPDYGDITDSEAGRDIIVTFSTPEEAGNTYGKIGIKVKPRESKITDDADLKTKILEDQPDIFDVYEQSTYDELKNVLKKWLENNTETDPDKNPTKITEDKIDIGTTIDVDDELDDLIPSPKSKSKTDKILDDFDDLLK